MDRFWAQVPSQVPSHLPSGAAEADLPLSRARAATDGPDLGKDVEIPMAWMQVSDFAGLLLVLLVWKVPAVVWVQQVEQVFSAQQQVWQLREQV